MGPNIAVVQTNWGVALLRLNQPAEAYTHLRVADRLAPDAFDPHFNLGLLLMSAGQPAASAAELEAALRIDPTSRRARDALAAARQAAAVQSR